MISKYDMQQMNDDMDELFRRAAENYPLNTGSADWNEVQKKLSAGGQEKITAPINKKNYKSLWLLLLLIPAVWIYTNSFPGNEQKQGNSQVKNNAGAAQKTIPGKGTSVIKTIPAHKDSPAMNHPVNSFALRTSGNINNTVSHNQKPILNMAVARANKIILPAEQSFLVTPSRGQSADKTKSDVIPDIKNNQDINQAENDHDTAAVLNGDKAMNKPGASDSNMYWLSKEQKKKNQKQVRPALYAGIVISPDISTVKFQPIKNIGVGIGLLVGYELNKKISVESGLLFDRKFYYSSGEYVNTKRISVPNYTAIKEVQGVCRMIEIPMNVKYTIINYGKTDLSVAAGIASYLMQKEIYDYTFERNGWQSQARSIYKKSSSDLLAVMNFSVGYNHRLGNAATLRIAPYIKIPLKGVGIVSLPIMSTGINIGITKKLFTY
jgi:hypothetical protein